VLFIYILHELKGPISLLTNFIYHMLNADKMVTCTFCRIKEFKQIISECVLNKWKKGRDPPSMIKRPKARILELEMKIKYPMDTRAEGSKKHC
jgi:hypothetical protein